MSLSYKERKMRGRRLLILEILEREPDLGLSEPFLERALNEMKESMSGEELHGHISWLAKRKLVAAEKTGEIFLVTLTRRGRDAANGHLKVKGVASPMPWLPRLPRE